MTASRDKDDDPPISPSQCSSCSDSLLMLFHTLFSVPGTGGIRMTVKIH